MREKAIRFGQTATLVGVLAEPSTKDPRRDRPAVVMLNSGILHRVGFCRMHVRLARRFADEGVTALRFDFSGIGDSEPRRDTLAFEESAPLEVRETMDYLEAKGFTTFILLGLCSGADMAFDVARVDRRVVGVAQLDAFAYRTKRFWLHHYGPRLTDRAAWGRLLRKVAGRGPKRRSGPTEMEEIPTYVRDFPPRDRVARDLRGLVERDVQQLYIYSGGQAGFYNYRTQFRDMFRDVDFLNTLQVEYVPEADHIFTGLGPQDFVIETTSRWMARLWPDSVGVPGEAPAAA
ncbi:MAG TPA: hypothetical protein VGA37_10990 [Gemmatimonadales bacterium]